MKEKIANRRVLIGQLETKLKEEKDELAKLIAQHQELCTHEDTEKIYSTIERNRERGMIFKGTECKDCGKFFPSKVWNEKIPTMPRLSKYCRVCDGEVKFIGRSGFACSGDREDWYKCKVCDYEQSEFVG